MKVFPAIHTLKVVEFTMATKATASTWPDSREFIDREMVAVAPEIRRKVLCDNAASLYGFSQ